MSIFTLCQALAGKEKIGFNGTRTGLWLCYFSLEKKQDKNLWKDLKNRESKQSIFKK